MRLYAAVSGRADPVVDTQYPHVLVSYALDPDLAILRSYTPESLMVDSGAFTAWTKGTAIDVDDYGQWAANFALKNIGTFKDLRFVNLDVIPGERGRPPTAAEVEHAAAASMTNADRLRGTHGLDVIEVFHYGEPGDALDALLERRRPNGVVGIGGSVGVDHGERIRWHDNVWAHVFANHADRRDAISQTVADIIGAVPSVAAPQAAGIVTLVPPLHGLGASNEDLARRYPWWSCDSSTYTIPQRFGRTLNHRGRQEFITRPRPSKVRDHRGTPPAVEFDMRRVKPAQRVEAIRILARWRRIERDMTRAWDMRGVRYAP